AGRGWSIAAWLSVLVLAVDSFAWFPNYISYFNFPRHKPYLAISDSNVDWGQCLIQIGHWLDEHPHGKRRVSICSFAGISGQRRGAYLRDYVEVVPSTGAPPRDGWLLLSPVREAGAYDRVDRFAPLRSAEPTAMIGRCFLVYDLDQIAGWNEYIDAKFGPAARPATTQASEAPSTGKQKVKASKTAAKTRKGH